MSTVVFGPVPSRRLGRSLGINNIPPKRCTYSCVYCQLGNTINMPDNRWHYYQPEELAQAAKENTGQVKAKEESIDYLSFVPDGEPTLDVNLGREIELLKPLGIKIAVITNASLTCHEDVREDLNKANWVSLKVDAVSEETWHRINRPRKSLKLDEILEGMLGFAGTFHGELTTETMLIQNLNDNSDELERIADFVSQLRPDKVYLSVPTRPPAVRKIMAANEQAINMAYQIFAERLNHVECLLGYEGNAFTSTGDIEDDLLGITSVHPMRSDAVKQLLTKANVDWAVVHKLIKDGSLVELEYQGKRFYARKLPKHMSNTMGI